MTQYTDPGSNPNNSGDRFNENVRRVTEEIEVQGSQLVDRVKQIVEEGNARRLILRNEEGRTLLEVPLTAGAVVGGALLWFNPLLAGIAAIGGLLLKVRIEIERDAVETLKNAADDVGDAVGDAARRVGNAASDTMADVDRAIDNMDDNDQRY